jgi:hypothetical protein
MTGLIGNLEFLPIRELIAIILSLYLHPNLFGSLQSVTVRVWRTLDPVTALLFFCL